MPTGPMMSGGLPAAISVLRMLPARELSTISTEM